VSSEIDGPLSVRARRAPRARSRLAGGPEGNERLTTLTGLLLIVLLAVLGVTIVRIGQLLWLHLFLGLVLLGPLAVKLASTGYRFIRYYTRDAAYRRKGPPAPALRALAPLVVLFTVLVFATGVALLVLGPGSRDPLVLLHKISFFAWLAVTAIHVLGHMPEIVRVLGTARATRRELITEAEVAGGAGRRGALITGVLAGLVVAVALLGQFSAWTH
jgi:type IV secretory pathway TrbD component